MPAWTFNGRIPGPIIRATEGDEIDIRFRNLGARPHNLHFHGAHAIATDGWQPVPPSGEALRSFRAGPIGLHPYHCDMTPAPEHISHGLYGVLLVDPAGGRRPAQEVVLTLGGFDTDGDGQSDLFGWNGVAGYYMKYPLKVRAGEPVRVYLTNMVTDVPVVSFHLHATVFDVYRSGTGLRPDERSDVVTLAPAERAILEFRLPERGRYMFHPHQSLLAERGAMGWFTAI
jgi:FtsP/CotA-like multicopper oxidase with cupredoxin domain